jgi:hypothetical protein
MGEALGGGYFRNLTAGLRFFMLVGWGVSFCAENQVEAGLETAGPSTARSPDPQKARIENKWRALRSG